MASNVQADPAVRGNDTGGIISWSCENEVAAPELAAGHCAWYGKYPRITGVHRQYGDYISFHCLWSPHIARYQIPAIRLRDTCVVQMREGHAVVRVLD